MRQVIKDAIDIYYIDENTLQVYRKSRRTNTMRAVKWINDRNGVSAQLFFFKDKEKNRIRARKVTFEHIVGTYVFNLTKYYIFEYINDNPFDINKDNIRIRYIIDICNEWKKIDDCEFMISKNGDLYDINKKRIVSPHKDISGYYYYSFNKTHIKRSHLVWKYFAKDNKIPKGYVIDHINNVADDDRIENLQCITIRKNIVKEHKRELPTGVVKDNNRYKTYISYTLDNIKYEGCYLGSFSSSEEAGICYQRALSLINDGVNPLKKGENTNIKYLFSNNTWYFTINRTGRPSKKHSGFRTYESALAAYNKLIEIDVLNETEEDKILRRGYFTFKVIDKKYEIKRLKYSTDEYLKAYRYYKQCKVEKRMNDFIDAIPQIRERIKNESKAVKKEILRKEKEKKEINKNFLMEMRKNKQIQHEAAKEEAKLKFVTNPNYKQNTYNDCYTINVPYIDGKWYYLHSFKDFSIVQEISEIMDKHKYTDDFPQFFENFKTNELPKYIERDNAYRSEKKNVMCNRLGYTWFKPRECWRVIKGVNKKEYCLGYYKDERCCKMILDEANNAIKTGVFDIWYAKIEEHKYRIKSLFNDGSLIQNKDNSTNLLYTICDIRYSNIMEEN